MPYFEIDTPAGVLGYDYTDDSAILSACRGRDVSIVIPDEIETLGQNKKLVVSAIAKKAFLSDKYLHSIEIPTTVRKTGEWAFAGCRNLEKITLHRNIVLSNGTFKDCISLNQVIIREEGESVFENEKHSEDVSFMLAAVVPLLEDRYLFDLGRAGHDEWIENWDKRMEVILREPDNQDFQELFACGEEDYEGRDTLETYIFKRICRKVRICLLRLLHDTKLSESRRKELIDFLYNHRAGAGESETWYVVLNEHGDEEEYYSLLNDCGCITDENVQLMLSDMGEKHARMKAYILKLNADDNKNDFFSDMEL